MSGCETSLVKPGIVQHWGRILKEGKGMDAVNTGAEVASARVQLMWSKWLHGTDHAETQTKMQAVISSLNKFGDVEGSERLARRLLASKVNTMGLDHWETLNALHALGFLLWTKHEDAEAESQFRFELEGRRLGNSPWSTANAAYMLSKTIDRQNNNPAEALKFAELALEEYTRDAPLHDMEGKQTQETRNYIQYLKDKAREGTRESCQ